MDREITGIILAGGHSTRLGMDKRRLRLWGDSGPTLLEHSIGLLTGLCTEVIVVLNDPEQWSNLDAHLVADVIPDAGPLSGLISGLSAAANEYALVIASDMPLLNLNLLRFMIAYPQPYSALIPRVPTEKGLRSQPLHALYNRATAKVAHAQLSRGVRHIIRFLDEIAPVYLDSDALSAYDPEGLSFLNVNTPDDLARVQALLDQRSE